MRMPIKLEKMLIYHRTTNSRYSIRIMQTRTTKLPIALTHQVLEWQAMVKDITYNQHRCR